MTTPAWHERLDVFHVDDLYSGLVDWVYPLTETVEEVHSGVLTYLKRSPVAAYDDSEFEELLRYDLPLACVAAILSYNHATAQQIAYMAGRGLDIVEATLDRLFRAGLVQEGFFAKAFAGANLYPGASPVYRLGDSARVSSWLGSMDSQRARSATLGSEIGRGPDNVRHNICATELACRLGEHHGDTFPLILGENSVSMKQLFKGNKVARKTQARADFAAVRADGLKVCFEVTNSVRIANLRTKVSRWAQVLKEERTGAVVFPLISDIPGGLDGLVEELVTTKALGVYASSFNHVASRIGFVDINQWFPQMGQTSLAWDSLTLRFGGQAGLTSLPLSEVECGSGDDTAAKMLKKAPQVLANPAAR